MQLNEIIKPDSVLCNAEARSKKHCLEILSELLVRSNPDVPSDMIFEGLIERERLGCTSLHRGVAFPHCRVEGLGDSVAALIRLSSAIDFDSEDGEPVDLVFGMMVPDVLDERGRREIKAVASLLRDEGLRGRLRAARSSSELYEALVSGADMTSSGDQRQALGR